MAVTLKDVAEKVGYSVGAVSQVLADPNHKRFSAAARERIIKAAKELNYTPNRFAAKLRGAQSNLIAMLLPWNTPEFMDGAEQAAHEAGYQFMFEFIREPTPKAELDAIKRVLGWGVDGIVWAPFNFAEHYESMFKGLSLGKTKFVLLHENMANLPFGASCVRTDVIGGMQQAVTHLFREKYQELVYITVGRNNPLRLRRQTAFLNACELLSVSSRVVGFESEYNIQASLREFLKGISHRTGIITMCAWLALDILMIAKELGIDIPARVGLVGMGDSLVGKHLRIFDVTTPALTALREPQLEMGQAAIKLLLDSMNGGELKEQELVLKEELIVRGSSGETHDMSLSENTDDENRAAEFQLLNMCIIK